MALCLCLKMASGSNKEERFGNLPSLYETGPDGLLWAGTSSLIIYPIGTWKPGMPRWPPHTQTKEKQRREREIELKRVGVLFVKKIKKNIT